MYICTENEPVADVECSMLIDSGRGTTRAENA